MTNVDFAHPSAAVKRKNRLPELVNQIEYMRRRLLECVKGQDHAVHTFADGLFNAEVLAAADKKRTRPKAIFTSDSKPKILLYADGYSEVILKNTAREEAEFFAADSIEKAVELAAENDIDFALINPALSGYDDENYDSRTVYASINAHYWDEGRKVFGTIKEKFPEMPIYLLESSKKELDFSLVTSFIRAGAEGKISLYSYDERDRINEIIAAISKNLYMRRRADEIASRHKILSFETAPQNNNGEIIAAMRNFKLVRAVEADDAEDILNSSEIPEIRFDDVIGAREAKESLAYFVKYFKNPKEFIAKGLSLPKGILLHGKPGTGKTMLAKAMAGESGASFFPAVGSMFLDGKNSDPEGVRNLFRKARKYAPSIIFIDEADTIAKQRTGSPSSKYEEAILNTLLAEMDGFASTPSMFGCIFSMVKIFVGNSFTQFIFHTLFYEEIAKSITDKILPNVSFVVIKLFKSLLYKQIKIQSQLISNNEIHRISSRLMF